MYQFDPFDPFFRSPGGAIKTPGVLTLRLKLRRGEAAHVSAHIRLDGYGAKVTPMQVIGTVGSYDVYACEIPFDTPGLYWYHFQIGHDRTVPERTGDAFQITVYAPAEQGPDWLQGGVIYHIFVDRFHRGGAPNVRPGGIFRPDWGGTPYYKPDEDGIMHNNDFFGGDFCGIIEKLPYLETLGVTCLYLSPVFKAASNHKYDTGDFLQIDPAFGGEAGFEALIQAAKKRGMRIILDGVFNHVGADSRYFNRYGHYDSVGAYQSKDSPYYDWFHFQNWPDTYDAWWGIELLPALNEASESYIDFICAPDEGVIAYWTKKGVAGWRLDVVDELPDVFLDPLCEAARRDNPEALIVGEVWEDASNKIAYSTRRRYFQGGQLDSVTNYPLKNAIISYIKDGNAPGLAETMAALWQNYPPPVLHGLMNILGTHDTMRILTVLGSEHLPSTREEMEHYELTDQQLQIAKHRLKLAALLQFTLPGVPCIYYADEAGMQGGADPFCRRCYPWGQEDQDLLRWYTNLAKLRRADPALKDGAYTLLKAHDGEFVFTRGEGANRLRIELSIKSGQAAIYKSVSNGDTKILHSALITPRRNKT
ncbi:MAG: glycoside hydrolase family 13 protein [Oscillospiraceae bacterium]|nr:glycoside hydrolase family 13 protein [Oscillospiraceae bacterium]